MQIFMFFLLSTFFLPAVDGVCVYKCLVNKDTEYCRVGKESILITLGYNSALLQFTSHSGKWLDIIYIWRFLFSLVLYLLSYSISATVIVKDSQVLDH